MGIIDALDCYMTLRKERLIYQTIKIPLANSRAHACPLVMNTVRSKVRWIYFSAFRAPVLSSGRPFDLYIHGAPADLLYLFATFGGSVGERHRLSAIAIPAVLIDADFCWSAIGIHTVSVDSL